MFELLGVPPQALFGQLLLGLINGAFYALLSLGLAIIFGLMNVINLAEGIASSKRTACECVEIRVQPLS